MNRTAQLTLEKWDYDTYVICWHHVNIGPMLRDKEDATRIKQWLEIALDDIIKVAKEAQA